jgi:hypothetical protein
MTLHETSKIQFRGLFSRALVTKAVEHRDRGDKEPIRKQVAPTSRSAVVWVSWPARIPMAWTLPVPPLRRAALLFIYPIYG